jgi:transcription initiation factor IIE alpha subunit
MPPLIFSLDKDGVQLNMNFICPQCRQPLSEHDVEVFTEATSKIKFACQEGVDETTIP